MIWTLLLVAVVLGCLLAVAFPVLRGARDPLPSGETSELDRLFEEKARTLRALKDLDHEHDSGALSEADWKESRSLYLAEAVRLNREIEEHTGVRAEEVS
jgi:hypothetical protein